MLGILYPRFRLVRVALFFVNLESVCSTKDAVGNNGLESQKIEAKIVGYIFIIYYFIMKRHSWIYFNLGGLTLSL